MERPAGAGRSLCGSTSIAKQRSGKDWLSSEPPACAAARACAAPATRWPGESGGLPSAG